MQNGVVRRIYPTAACAETERKFEKSSIYFPDWLIHVPGITNNYPLNTMNVLNNKRFRKLGGNVYILRGIEHKSRVIRKAYDSGRIVVYGQSFNPMIGEESFIQ